MLLMILGLHVSREQFGVEFSWILVRPNRHARNPADQIEDIVYCVIHSTRITSDALESPGVVLDGVGRRKDRRKVVICHAA